MDQTLRCNVLNCRVLLSDKALVTTCSHIFCLECDSRMGLSKQAPSRERLCPVCEVQLSHPDDAVITVLSPTEDYKTSVLSGLSPGIIMECAGRALSFWAYQMTQETVYQEHVCKAMREKYSNLHSRLNNTVNEANMEIAKLRDKLTSMAIDQENLQRKNLELAEAYKNETQKCLRAQELYDRLKHKAMLGQVQDAATEAVDHTLGPAGGSQVGGSIVRPELVGRQAAAPYRGARFDERLDGHGINISQAPGTGAMGTSWPGPFPAQAMSIPETPSTHRLRAGAVGPGLSTVPGLVVGTPAAGHRSPRTQEGAYSTQQHHLGGARGPAGVGLSPRVRASYGPPEIDKDGFLVPTARPRAVQRPGAYDANSASSRHPDILLGGNSVRY